MTNKELQILLLQFPTDMEVLISVDGVRYTEPGKPMIRFMGTSQKKYLTIRGALAFPKEKEYIWKKQKKQLSAL